MFVQWPWRPQGAPELHSSTSVELEESEWGRCRDTGHILLEERRLGEVMESVFSKRSSSTQM